MKFEPDSQEISDLEFASEVFPKIKDLSESDKNLILEEIRKNHIKAFSKAKDVVFAWKLFFFGITTGVVGNLWASVLYDFFKKFELLYIVFLIFITIILIRVMLSIFIDNINASMSENQISKKMWDYVKNKKSKKSK